MDGPEFDGHAVDFDLLTKRLAAYKDMERQAMDDHACKLKPGIANSGREA